MNPLLLMGYVADPLFLPSNPAWLHQERAQCRRDGRALILKHQVQKQDAKLYL